MPLERVKVSLKRAGFRWGKRGKVYTYPIGNARARSRARKKALKQGRAIKWRERM